MTHERCSTCSTKPQIRKDGITQTSLVVVLKRLKDPPTWLKVTTSLEKTPTTHTCIRGPRRWNPQHDDVIKWKHFPRYWPFVQGIHRSLVNSPHKGQWRQDLIFTSICAWISSWVNNREAGDSRRHRAHYDVTVMNARRSYENLAHSNDACKLYSWFSHTSAITRLPWW